MCIVEVDIDDSVTNGKRVMLIGTAILIAVDQLIDSGLFGNDSEIRNLGFILGLLLAFAVEYAETCPANEYGWRIVVLRKLDQHGVKVSGILRLEFVAASVRSDAMDDEEEGYEEEEPTKLSDLPNFVEAYKPAPLSSTWPVENPNDAKYDLVRSWAAWNWKQEVRLPTSTRMSSRFSLILDLTAAGIHDTSWC